MENLELVRQNVGGSFWTREDEMVEELEELGYEVTEVNGEYVAITVPDDDAEYILYLGHANTTMWVERVREM